MRNKLTFFLSSALIILAFGSCQKMDRPELGDYLEDSSPPTGPLRFFAAMDGSTNDQLRNAVDSMKANFPVTNGLTSITRADGKAMQGADGKVIVYGSANDMNKATSFTIAFWMKNTDQGRTEFVFSLVDDKYGWHHSAIFLLLEHGNPTATTLKLGLMDQWLEWPDANKFPRPLMDGNWHHLAFVYDESSSTMTYYFDGAVVTPAPAGAVNVRNGGSPRGPVDLTTAKQLVLAGWNKHASIAGPGDDWIKSFTGGLDQFRLYNKALSAAEVNALYVSEQ